MIVKQKPNNDIPPGKDVIRTQKSHDRNRENLEDKAEHLDKRLERKEERIDKLEEKQQNARSINQARRIENRKERVQKRADNVQYKREETAERYRKAGQQEEHWHSQLDQKDPGTGQWLKDNDPNRPQGKVIDFQQARKDRDAAEAAKDAAQAQKKAARKQMWQNAFSGIGNNNNGQSQDPARNPNGVKNPLDLSKIDLDNSSPESILMQAIQQGKPEWDAEREKKLRTKAKWNAAAAAMRGIAEAAGGLGGAKIEKHGTEALDKANNEVEQLYTKYQDEIQHYNDNALDAMKWAALTKENRDIREDNQAHQLGMQNDQQDWQSNENGVQRAWSSNEEQLKRYWQSGENALDRGHDINKIHVTGDEARKTATSKAEDDINVSHQTGQTKENIARANYYDRLPVDGDGRTDKDISEWLNDGFTIYDPNQEKDITLSGSQVKYLMAKMEADGYLDELQITAGESPTIWKQRFMTHLLAHWGRYFNPGEDGDVDPLFPPKRLPFTNGQSESPSVVQGAGGLTDPAFVTNRPQNANAGTSRNPNDPLTNPTGGNSVWQPYEGNPTVVDPALLEYDPDSVGSVWTTPRI